MTSAGSGHRGRRIAECESDEAGVADRLQVMRGNTEMMAPGDAGEADAELLRAPNRFLHG